MTGGFLQLVSYGSQDFYLTGNPQISFFKTVYRRYTNFSMDFYQIRPEIDIGLSDKETTDYTFNIDRHGDLISDMYLVYKLPAIYSDNNTKFRWIKNVGASAIEHISIHIGSAEIDKHYGEWFNIWHELTMTEAKKRVYNELIGNVPEMYNPELSPKFTSYPNKPKIGKIPSIQERIIRVPLIFWFNRNPSLALPLVALQYYPVRIEVTFRRVIDLYTVIDKYTDGNILGSRIVDAVKIIENGIETVKTNRNSYNLRIKADPEAADYNTYSGLQNFVKEEDIIRNLKSNTFLKLPIEPFLEVNYIFLDKEEMNKFAKSEHKYLIDKVRQVSFTGIVESKTLNLKELNHPTSYMVITSKRSDIGERNDWNNYTNWITPGIPWNSYNEFFEPYFDDDNCKEVIGESNYDIKGKENILKNISLNLNGVKRFMDNDENFYNNLQPYSFGINQPSKGVLLYSFSLNPFEYQPSGSCNMSKFNNIDLLVETQSVPTINLDVGEKIQNKYTYDINVYGVSYNILRITGGMGNLEFSN